MLLPAPVSGEDLAYLEGKQGDAERDVGPARWGTSFSADHHMVYVVKHKVRNKVRKKGCSERDCLIYTA